MKIFIAVLSLILIVSLGGLVLAGVNNQNAIEEQNTATATETATEYSQFNECVCSEECEGIQLQKRIRSQKDVFENRARGLAAGENGEQRQQRNQMRKNRFAFEG